MLKLKYSHSQYQEFVRDALTNIYINTGQEISIITNFKYLSKFWNADLTKIVDIISGTYAKSDEGAQPKDAVSMFRSLILMPMSGETSIPRWVKTLRSNPFYAIVSGFSPACNNTNDGYNADSTPGVGTFYDFMKRLINVDKAPSKIKSRKKRKKPRKKGKKNQKAYEPKETVTARLAKRVIRHSSSPLPENIESTLNTILKEMFVLPSLQMGILGDPNKFNTAGDGTSMPSNASHYGKKVCECKGRCNCHRIFSDPTASWGWDSYREIFYYGHSYHTFTACDCKYDLPIHIKCVSAKRHDSVTGIFALKELIDLYPQIKFDTAAFDSAYDATAFYQLLNYYNIKAIIDLNPRRSKPDVADELVDFDNHGVPCAKKCGKKLRNWGIIQKSFRRKYLFPVQCDNCDKCCAYSKKTFYVHLKNHPRFATDIPRGSKRWRSYYKRRTTTERVNDRIKEDFKVKNAVCLSRNIRSVRTFLAAFCCYIDAWNKEKAVTISDIFPALAR